MEEESRIASSGVAYGMMRVLLQTYAFWPSWGGVQKFVLTLYRYVQAAGIKTAIATSARVVISAQEAYFVMPWTDKKGTYLKRFRFNAVSSVGFFLSYFRYCVFLYFFRPQIVHLIFMNVDASFAVRAKPIFRFKLLTSCRGSDILRFEEHNRFRQGLIKETLLASDAITAVSGEIASKVRQIMDSNVAVEIIPNGIELKETQPGNHSSNIFVFVGHLDENKSPEFLVRAFREFQKEHNQYKLVMIGTGPLRHSLVNLVKNESLEEIVELTGQMSADATFEYIQKSVALILPSKNEGCPNVVLEAMSAGTPVIGSNRSGIKELIRDGYNGLLYEYDSSKSLLECMEKVIRSAEFRGRLVRNAFHTLREKHDQKKVLQQYIMIYKKLVAKAS